MAIIFRIPERELIDVSKYEKVNVLFRLSVRILHINLNKTNYNSHL